MELIAELAGQGSAGRLRLASKSWLSAVAHGLRAYTGLPRLGNSRLAQVCTMFPLLTHLDLGGCSSGLTDSALSSISTLERLTHLRLASAEGTPPSGIVGSQVGGVWLEGLPQLQELNLEGCANLVDEALAGLGKLSLLTRLSLNGCVSLTDRWVPEAGGNLSGVW